MNPLWTLHRTTAPVPLLKFDPSISPVLWCKSPLKHTPDVSYPLLKLPLRKNKNKKFWIPILIGWLPKPSLSLPVKCWQLQRLAATCSSLFWVLQKLAFTQQNHFHRIYTYCYHLGDELRVGKRNYLSLANLASPLVPHEWGCECGGPLGLAGHSMFSCWVQVSSQCSPQHLPSLFICWWLYGMKGIRLSGSRKASGAQPSKSHTAARALCGPPPWLPVWPHQSQGELVLVPTANDAHAYSVLPNMQHLVRISDSCTNSDLNNPLDMPVYAFTVAHFQGIICLFTPRHFR